MILAANFKMNHTRSSTKEYINGLDLFLKDSKIRNDIYVFPPATALDSFDTNIKIGAQNGYPAINGSYTGEIGLEQLEELGIKTIIIGHSERRHRLGENQDFIIKKFNFFKAHDFTIFYCIGETLEVKEAGEELIKSYLKMQLDGIDLDYSNLIIAYEPVWAIGGKKSATTEDIKKRLEYIRTFSDAKLLYGGSVNLANIKEIISIPNCSGALIGRASWELDSFCKMIELTK